MEEQKKDVKQDETKKKGIMEIVDGMPVRSLMLWCLAGIYLLYTGYRLCSNVVQGKDGGGIGFLLAGILFLAIGGGLVFLGLKGYLKANKREKEEEKKAAEAAAAEEPEVAEEISEEPEKPRKMSISERAALASQIDEEPEE